MLTYYFILYYDWPDAKTSLERPHVFIHHLLQLQADDSAPVTCFDGHNRTWKFSTRHVTGTMCRFKLGQHIQHLWWWLFKTTGIFCMTWIHITTRTKTPAHAGVFSFLATLTTTDRRSFENRSTGSAPALPDARRSVATPSHHAPWIWAPSAILQYTF